MPARRALVALALAAAVVAPACNPWTPAAYVDQLVWSDDDGLLALAELRFEQRQGDPLAGTTEKRAFRHQLLRAAVDDSERAPIGDEREGQNGAELYFMRTGGYLVVSVVDADTGAIAYERVDADDGAAAAIPRPTEADVPVYAVPSPDAALIASIAVVAFTVVVDLLDAQTLAPVRARAEIDVDGPDWTWREDGAFVVTDGVDDAWALTATTDFAASPVPGCTTPKTTSSAVSSTGVLLSTTPDGEILFGDPDPALAFGCQ